MLKVLINISKEGVLMSKGNLVAALTAATALSGCLATAPTQPTKTDGPIPTSVTTTTTAPAASASAPTAAVATGKPGFIQWGDASCATKAANATQMSRDALTSVSNLNNQCVQVSIKSTKKPTEVTTSVGKIVTPECGVMSSGAVQTGSNVVTGIASRLGSTFSSIVGTTAGHAAGNAVGGGTVGRVAQQAGRQAGTEAANTARPAVASVTGTPSVVTGAAAACQSNVDDIAKALKPVVTQWRGTHAADKPIISVSTDFKVADYPVVAAAIKNLGNDDAPSAPAATGRKPRGEGAPVAQPRIQ